MHYFRPKIPLQVIEGKNEKVYERHQATQNTRHRNLSASQNILCFFFFFKYSLLYLFQVPH